jgi:hypothetical protein
MEMILLIAVLWGSSQIDLRPESVDVVEPLIEVKDAVFARGELHASSAGYFISNLSTPPKTSCYRVSDESADVPNAIEVFDVEPLD